MIDLCTFMANAWEGLNSILVKFVSFTTHTDQQIRAAHLQLWNL